MSFLVEKDHYCSHWNMKPFKVERTALMCFSINIKLLFFVNFLLTFKLAYATRNNVNLRSIPFSN